MKRQLLIPALAILASFGVAAKYPEYINQKANTLQGKVLAHRAPSEGQSLQILHIGDSHIQAEMVTNHLRKLLQERYGNSGRGFTSPLRLAGTNQSHDYRMTVLPDKDGNTPQLHKTRLLKFPWEGPRPGLGGVGVYADTAIRVSIVPLTQGHAPIHSATTVTSRDIATTNYPQGVDSVVISLRPGEAFYGIRTTNGHSGVEYSAIGNNGATYSDYGLIDGFHSTLGKVFNPDIVIYSMGANEGFSNMTDAEIAQAVTDQLKCTRNTFPDADIIVWLPMESQKSSLHGTPRAKYGVYAINDRVRQSKDIIMKAAQDNGVTVWDFYTVSGGQGASDKWLADKLMNTDHIHLLRPGYELQANLFFDALTKAWE